MFLMVRAHWIDVGGTSTGFGAGATVGDPWLEGLQLDQLKIYEEGKLSEPLYRVIKDNIRFPESSLGDMKSQMAACRSPAAASTSCSTNTAATRCSRPSSQSSTRPSRSAATWSRNSPTASTKRSRRSTTTGVLKGEPVPIRVKVTIKKGEMTIDLSGARPSASRASIRARSLVRGSRTRRSRARTIPSTRVRSAR
jgi:N-methylhydantoinase B